jgi:acyl carrier protein
MADTFEQVKSIVVDLLGVEPDKVTREARFREDLEADSLDLVELIMEFEERFGETVSDEDAQQLTTVGQVVDYVDQHMTAGA